MQLCWRPDFDLHLFFLAVGDAVDEERLADDVARRHPRVEGRERVLKDDLHLAAIGPHIGLAEPGHVMLDARPATLALSDDAST